ncbi:unnamed protein product [Rodentolepis nana]|uniref:Large ribosomal subunit protein bL17m n=1 Tax=Rodentolepis nana TaxID=102285 RepID=A0A0R3T1N7_RODNA|nr:unnamed protein product [Rodentolepis nana]
MPIDFLKTYFQASHWLGRGIRPEPQVLVPVTNIRIPRGSLWTGLLVDIGSELYPLTNEQTVTFVRRIGLRFVKPPSTFLLGGFTLVDPQLPSIGLAANQLLMHVPRLSQRLRRGEGIGGGPTGRMSWLRRCVSALVDEERIELPWPVALETRQYAERLIQEAVRAELATTDLSKFQSLEELLQPPWIEYPEIAPLLELSAFWLQKPELVTKLLKVLVPRYRFYNRSYTRVFRLQRPPYPNQHAFISHGFGVLELHGNPWPPIGSPHLPKRIKGSNAVSSEPFKHKYFINVLLNAAREEYKKSKRTPPLSK